MALTKASLGITTPLSLGCLSSLIVMHSYTRPNDDIRARLRKLQLKPIVENGRLDRLWMRDAEGRMVNITDAISKQMQMLVTEGEYPEIITKADLVKALR